MKMRLLSLAGCAAGVCLVPPLWFFFMYVSALLPEIDPLTDALLFLIVILPLFGAILGSPLLGLLGVIVKKPALYVVAAFVSWRTTQILLFCVGVAYLGVILRSPAAFPDLVATRFFWLLTAVGLVQVIQTALYAVAAVLCFKKPRPSSLPPYPIVGKEKPVTRSNP